MDGFELNFLVKGDPVAQSRPRVTRTGHTYYPKQIYTWKEVIQAAAREAYHGPPLHRFFAITLDYGLRRPQSKVWKTKSMPREYWAGRGDLDNYDKAVLDALTGIIWENDNLVVRKTSSKSIVEATFISGEFMFAPVGVEVQIRGI